MKSRTKREITLVRIYPYARESVWRALTDPAALERWLLPTNFRPRLGHRFRFVERSRTGRRREVRCEVVELDAPRRLAYTWQAEHDELPTLVSWTLETAEGGTRLILEHTLPDTPATPDATLTNMLRTTGLQTTGLRTTGLRTTAKFERRTRSSITALAADSRRGSIRLSGTRAPLRCLGRLRSEVLAR